MFNISAIKGKFKRSGINCNKTFLWENESSLLKNVFVGLLKLDEVGIIYYVESEKYGWCLTNKRIIFLDGNTLFLSDLKQVDIINIKENPSQKTTNRELTLFTKSGDIKLFVEENSWHLFYNIFKFIISKNN
jgi:hypothetical protein